MYKLYHEQLQKTPFRLHSNSSASAISVSSSATEREQVLQMESPSDSVPMAGSTVLGSFLCLFCEMMRY